MFCITKVDQHGESGLQENITSMHTMRMISNNGFAVRNRTQEENDQQLQLSKVCELEEPKTEAALTRQRRGVPARIEGSVNAPSENSSARRSFRRCWNDYRP